MMDIKLHFSESWENETKGRESGGKCKHQTRKDDKALAENGGEKRGN